MADGKNELKRGLKSRHILIVGGSSGMGLALAEKAVTAGAHVTIAGRSAERLAAARQALSGAGPVKVAAADVTREEEVIRLFEAVGSLDHIVTTAADIAGVYELLPALETELERMS